jgi:outer membrane murein-binding lipoprotein Lpp
MNKMILSLAVSGSLIFLGCAKDSNSNSTSGISSGLTTVNSKLESAASVIDVNSYSSSSLAHTESDNIGPFATGLSTVWTQASGVLGLDSASVTLKKWFTDEFNPAYVNSNGAKVTFVGRVSNAMNLICFLGQLNFPTDSTNLPTNGSHTGTITSAMATTCKNPEAASTSVTMTVTTPSDTTLYDKFISVNMGSNCPFRFKIRMNTAAINIATGEDQSCDSRDQASGAVVLYNKTTDVIRFTYISQAFNLSSPGGFEFYRGYYDGKADTSYVLGIYATDDGNSGDTGLTTSVAYTVVGKPTAGGTVAVSTRVKGQSGGGAVSDGTYNGCVDSSGSTSGGATLACTLTGVDIDTPYANTIVPARAANSAIADIYNISDTAGVGFTNNTDMF